MAEQSNNNANSFLKGLQKNLPDFYVGNDAYTHARNAVNNTENGNFNTLSSEPANFKCLNFPYVAIGFIPTHADEWIVFSTDNGVNSEIGVYKDDTCSYTKLVNDSCLNFSTKSLITGAARYTFECGYRVYWSDGGRNPDRVMDVNNVPWKVNKVKQGDCYIDVPTNRLDCERIRLAPLMSVPCITLNKAVGTGELPNGTYQLAIAYAVNEIKVTDYVMTSNICSIFHHSGTAGAIQATFTNLETNEFSEMIITLIGKVQGQTIAKKLGIYSTNTTSLYIDNIGDDKPSEELAAITRQTPIHESSDAIYAINNYLLRTGPRTRPDFNYQPLANEIKTEAVVVKKPFDYYRKGGIDIGYFRDEVYSFFIRWIYNTGERSASYHIPGREKEAIDLNFMATNSIIGETQGWQTFNSAYADITGKWRMGYWEAATEKYPDNNPTVWGNLCGLHIRHHRMPDATVHPTFNHFDNTSIRILGVKFTNIKHPLDINGNPIDSIVGYEILRGSREGNKTIIAKGMLNNMVKYIAKSNGTDTADDAGMFSNYPYNDLRKDPFLVNDFGVIEKGQRWEEKTEWTDKVATMLNGEGGYYKNYQSFHSPDTIFSNPLLSVKELKIYNELWGYSKGRFETPYRHPKFKVLTRFANIIASTIGIASGIALFGGAIAGNLDLNLPGTADVPIRVPLSMNPNFPGETIGAVTVNTSPLTYFVWFLSVATNLILAGITSFLTARAVRAQMLHLINGLVPAKQFATQYNSHGFYSRIKPAPNKKRFNLNDAAYISEYMTDYKGIRVNNWSRTKYVLLDILGQPDIPTVVDNSRFLISDKFTSTYEDDTLNPTDGSTFNSTEDNTTGNVGNSSSSTGAATSQGETFGYDDGTRDDTNDPSGVSGSHFSTSLRNISSWYASIKAVLPNQYGQLENIKQIPVSNCVHTTTPDKSMTFSSPVLFGGDCYINRYTEKNPFYFFNDWLSNVTEDYQYDYRNHINVPWPRFWVDNTKIYGDFFEGITKFRNLDDRQSRFFYVYHGYFYLFYNGVRDFFVESEANVGYRDWGDESSMRFYDPYEYTNLTQMFRSDEIKLHPSYSKYDYSLSASRFYTQYSSASTVLPRDFDPKLAESCYSYYPRRVIYSLPQDEEFKRDNWRSFLLNNYKDFTSKPTAIKSMGRTGAVIYMEEDSPLSFVGVDTLQTSVGTKITIGDGGLFQQALQSVSNADRNYQYGSCTHKRGILNTPYGLFYVSQPNGRVFEQSDRLNSISDNGMKWWFAKYLPSRLLKYYPEAKELDDNPVDGVGILMGWDNTNDILYITKRDYIPKKNCIRYTKGVGFTYTLGLSDCRCPVGQYWDGTRCLKNAQREGTLTGHATPSAIMRSTTPPTEIRISLNDPEYFEDISWTISYDAKNKQWISFHDYHPDWYISGKNHFATVTHQYRGNSNIWKHNQRWDLFCNFYGKQHPFEVEYIYNTGQDVATLRGVEYQLEAYKYKFNGMDKFHVLDENFNKAFVYNSEQNSGELRLELASKTDPYQNTTYPIVGNNYVRILYNHEEQKYRFNQFNDLTKDRGEFTSNIVQMWNTSENGYEFTLNPLYIDYQKAKLEWKKFRHTSSRIKLILDKINSFDKQFTLKFIKTNPQESKR